MSHSLKLVFIVVVAIFAFQIINMVITINLSSQISDMKTNINSKLSIISGISAEISGLRNQVNNLTNTLNEQSWLREWEFILVDFSENNVKLRGRWTFSKINKNQKLYILLHPINSEIEERIPLNKITDVVYSTTLTLDPEIDYTYQIVAEDNNEFISSEQLNIPAYYYKAQPFSAEVDFFVNRKNQLEYAELRFRLQVYSKPYFEELRIDSAELIIKEDNEIIDTKLFTEAIEEDKSKTTPIIAGRTFYIYYSLSEQKNLNDLDFLCEVTYKNGLKKTTKLSSDSEKWEAIIMQYEAYMANKN
ncbi:MAG: hypothetical protein FXF54_00950 [Kosmotoga sp.]|nr:MAG: hypothetical protein FXF54_00950 [Kosmotoga sp.]